jgi:RNA recognition motif-containing protein
MVTNIFVGNLPYSTTVDEMRRLFEEYGPVHSAKIITDRMTGRSRGFGFVEMDNEPAQAAIQALDGYEVDGRALRVNQAREREPRPRRF